MAQLIEMEVHAMAGQIGTQPREILVTFGAVTVRVDPPTESEIRQNIEAGQAALRRMKSALIKPGVIIKQKNGVPLYFGSADNPDLLIREKDGVKTLGRFVNGRFRPSKAVSAQYHPGRRVKNVNAG